MVQRHQNGATDSPQALFDFRATSYHPQIQHQAKTTDDLPLAASPVITPVIHSDAVQSALVGVTSMVLEEYDPTRPNDYEEYRRERKKKAMEAEVRRELDLRRLEEEEKERRERATMNGSAAAAVAPRSPSPPSNADGFMIGKSESGGLGVGVGGQMTAAQRMMAKIGWKQGQGLEKQEQGITTPLMAKKTDKRAGVIVNTSETKPEKMRERRRRGVRRFGCAIADL